MGPRLLHRTVTCFAAVLRHVGSLSGQRVGDTIDRGRVQFSVRKLVAGPRNMVALHAGRRFYDLLWDIHAIVEGFFGQNDVMEIFQIFDFQSE